MATVTLFTLEHPRGLAGATLVEDGPLELVYEHGGRRGAVPAHAVVRVVRTGDRHEAELLRLDGLLARAAWRAVEARAAAMLETPGLPGWAAARAAGTLAAARLLRARVEGRGADEALAAFARAESLARGTRLWARASYGLAEAALLAGQLERARAAFARLATGELAALAPWRWLGALGLLRTQVAAGQLAPALEGLAALEQTAGADPFGVEAAMQARVVRAEVLLAQGKPRAAAELLEPAREDPVWAGSPLLPLALNTLGAIYRASAGRHPDGSWKPEGLLAALPLHLRVVRYVVTDAVERARALAGAVAGLRLAGQAEVADMLAAELAERFPQAAAARELSHAPRAPGD